MNLGEIVWPVFRLGEHKPTVEGGVVFYSKEYVDKDSTSSFIGFRLVDDRNVDAPTLGLRRLHLKYQLDQSKLFPITKAIYFLVDLIKLAKPTTWFIDNHGNLFQYKKSTRAKLACKKIKRVLPATNLGCILEIEGLDQRFKSLRHPQNGERYAGILQWGLGYMLYGLYLDPFKTTYRLI
jgi:hypothetical protein